jgi:hypothetical protein
MLLAVRVTSSSSSIADGTSAAGSAQPASRCWHVCWSWSKQPALAVVRGLEPHATRAIVANPLQVNAIAYAQVKTDKIDAGVLALAVHPHVLASISATGGHREGRHPHRLMRDSSG